MRLFHVTSAAVASKILTAGFQDGRGHYGVPDRQFKGVWLSDQPLTSNEGANGDTVLNVVFKCDLDDYYEWIEEGKEYREWLVPASFVNNNATVSINKRLTKGGRP